MLAFYRLQTSDVTRQTELVLSSVKHIADDETLVLSLTWHPIRPNVIGLTLSDGRVCLVTSSGNTDAVLWSQDTVIDLQDVHEHELEAWTMTFTPDTAKVLSGGDDMILQCSHIPDGSEEHVRLWQDRRLHQAGVTAILPLSDTLVVTGNYDDHIRLLSLPDVGRRNTLAELNLGGGVWRLKLLSPTSQPNGSADNESASVVSALRSITRYASFIHTLLALCSRILSRAVAAAFHPPHEANRIQPQLP